MSNWSIAVTVKAPLEMINVFLEHHLKLNPKEIFLYLDAPNDFNEDSSFIADERIKIHYCDESFWLNREHFHILRHKKGQRPEAVEHRQYHNMLDAHSKSTADWLLMLDIDELAYTNEDISNVLSKYPSNVFSVRCAPIEAIYKDKPPQNIKEVFATPYFKSRKKFSYAYWDEIYPNKNLRHKAGFFGHISGKSFLRTNEEIFTPSCHLSRPVDKDLAHAINCEDILIQHFEAMTPELFAEKNHKRIKNEFFVPFLEKGSKYRIAYIGEEYAKHGFSSFYKIYNEMHVLPSATMDQAVEDGFIIDINHINPKKQKAVVTHHKTILCMDLDENIVKTVDPKLISNLNYVPLNFVHTYKSDSIPQKGYFYFEKDNIPVYLYMDRFNQLRISESKKAQFLDMTRYAKSKFSLTFHAKSLRVNSKGLVKLDADEISAWEQFRYIS